MSSRKEREEAKNLAQHDHLVTGSYHSALSRSHPVGFSGYGSTAALGDPVQSPAPLLDLWRLCAIPSSIAHRSENVAPFGRTVPAGRGFISLSCNQNPSVGSVPRQAQVGDQGLFPAITRKRSVGERPYPFRKGRR